VIKQLDPDLVHSHLTHCQFTCRLLPSVKLVTTEHNTSNRRRHVLGGRIFDRWLYSRYRRIVCISKATERALVKWQPSLSDKTTVIHNGVNLSLFSSQTSNMRESRMRLVAIGRLEEQKNFQAAIYALAACAHTELSLDIYGEGAQKRMLETLVNRLGLAKRVIFKGWCENIPSILGNYAGIVISSKWEGFGLVAVEAMASGVVPICFRVEGLDEVVDEECAILAEPTVKDLTSALNTFWSMSEDALQNRVRVAKQRALKFDSEQMADEYLSLYAGIIYDAKN
jgi:glycosyltransferase involved in cell wall biosynthesis